MKLLLILSVSLLISGCGITATHKLVTNANSSNCAYIERTTNDPKYAIDQVDLLWCCNGACKTVTYTDSSLNKKSKK